MRAFYPFVIEREMGCTEVELATWLPDAVGGLGIEWGDRRAQVRVEGGSVSIAWEPQSPRRIAALALPRLQVRIEARDVDAIAWQAFMRYFDLYTQRGGG